jgi:hypothetical protein
MNKGALLLCGSVTLALVIYFDVFQIDFTEAQTTTRAALNRLAEVEDAIIIIEHQIEDLEAQETIEKAKIRNFVAECSDDCVFILETLDSIRGSDAVKIKRRSLVQRASSAADRVEEYAVRFKHLVT